MTISVGEPFIFTREQLNFASEMVSPAAEMISAIHETISASGEKSVLGCESLLISTIFVLT